MSLMSGLFVGATGLQTSQNSLHTTAHNLSNIETAGYVRQQTLHADISYNNISNASCKFMFKVDLSFTFSFKLIFLALINLAIVFLR